MTINNPITYSDAYAPIQFNASKFSLHAEKDPNPDNEWVRHEDSAGLASPTVVITPRQKMPTPEVAIETNSLKERQKLLKRKQLNK